MRTQVNEGHHWRRLIRGLAAILLATAGTAAVMAWMPSSIEAADVELALDKLQAPLAKPGDRQGQNSDPSTAGDARVGVKCAECGVIASKREIGQLGGGVDPAAVFGLARGLVMSDPLRGDARSQAARRAERRSGY